MARRTRKVLSLDVESALVLMQEIYNDIGENNKHCIDHHEKNVKFHEGI